MTTYWIRKDADGTFSFMADDLVIEDDFGSEAEIREWAGQQAQDDLGEIQDELNEIHTRQEEAAAMLAFANYE